MTKSWQERLARVLNEPVDTSSLAAFRLLFGLTMACACARYLLKGWVQSQLLEPQLLFPYPGLDFIKPLPAPFMQLHVALLSVAALSIAVGLFTRSASLLFAVGFGYLELLDRSTYLNHYYLVSCLSLLLVLMPAGGRYSLDALRARQQIGHAPALLLYTLRLQVAVVYLFAGAAKLNADWLFEAQPLRMWLSARSDLPLLGPLLAQPESAFIASWLGALFDLSIVPLLLWQRTRGHAFAALLVFHLATGALLPIGMFPWIMICAATLLLPASWPARWLPGRAPGRIAAASRMPRWLVPALVGHCAVQVALPLYQQLRHPDAAWSYRGFNFAWRVMVAEKAGHLSLQVHDPATGKTEQVASSQYLTALQQRAVAADPDLIASFAQQLAQRAARQLGRPVAVYVDAFASLNGRPSARLVDPAIDVSESVPDGWLLPAPR